jgi:hypothetical protein
VPIADNIQFGTLTESVVGTWVSSSSAILQVANAHDKEVPHILWNQYGYVPEDEIVVTAVCGALAFYAKAKTWLVHPALADRIFGTDADDIALGQQLGDALWERYGELLKRESNRLDAAGAGNPP